MKTIIIVAVSLAFLGLASSAEGDSRKPRFSDLTDAIAERQQVLAQHRFFRMLSDESIPATKRMSFTPYWAFFAMCFADVLDTWAYIPNPQSELEERINIFVREDTFHYNFFFDDMKVLGYTLDDFGSFEGVMRHLWGDESRSVREFVYAWAFWSKKFDDPLVTIATFEAIEAGLLDLFETTYSKVFLPEGGLKGLRYFGGIHVELEMNHTHTGWFKGEEIVSTLDEREITELQKAQGLEAINAIFDRFGPMYDAMYNLAVAEDSIRPEKYKVEGAPVLHEFPADHPNRRVEKATKDEL